MHGNRTNWKLPLGFGLAVLVAAVVVIPTVAFAGDDAAAPAPAGHDMAAHGAGLQPELAQVRRVTARFHDLDAALEAGYELGWVNGAGIRIITGCVAHPTAGAMGYHYFNAELMDDNAVDALEPEVLVYESGPNGKRKLVAVEWVVRGPNSNPPGPAVPPIPTVLGMEMHILVPPPGPAFYLLHAWVWKPNPAGMFADFNPNVSCP
ncbi:MAG: hypothetical protein H0U46_09220 [Actinobacteria bacterium]|nr:hypothetical protein [Actinomycetota bacterium]